MNIEGETILKGETQSEGQVQLGRETQSEGLVQLEGETQSEGRCSWRGKRRVRRNYVLIASFSFTNSKVSACCLGAEEKASFPSFISQVFPSPSGVISSFSFISQVTLSSGTRISSSSSFRSVASLSFGRPLNV